MVGYAPRCAVVVGHARTHGMRLGHPKRPSRMLIRAEVVVSVVDNVVLLIWAAHSLVYTVPSHRHRRPQVSTTNEATLLEKSADILRTVPLAAGAMGVVAVVLNRAVFGVCGAEELVPRMVDV